MNTKATDISSPLRPNRSHLWLDTAQQYPAYSFRVAQADDAGIVQNIWDASQEVDEPASRARDERWSLVDWATASYILLAGESAIGVAAFRFGAEMPEAAEVRLALCPSHRQTEAAYALLDAAVALGMASGAPEFHLYLPKGAAWAGETAWRQGFRPFQNQAYHTADSTEISAWDIWRLPLFTNQAKHISGAVQILPDQ